MFFHTVEWRAVEDSVDQQPRPCVCNWDISCCRCCCCCCVWNQRPNHFAVFGSKQPTMLPYLASKTQQCTLGRLMPTQCVHTDSCPHCRSALAGHVQQRDVHLRLWLLASVSTRGRIVPCVAAASHQSPGLRTSFSNALRRGLFDLSKTRTRGSNAA